MVVATECSHDMIWISYSIQTYINVRMDIHTYIHTYIHFHVFVESTVVLGNCARNQYKYHIPYIHTYIQCDSVSSHTGVGTKVGLVGAMVIGRSVGCIVVG